MKENKFTNFLKKPKNKQILFTLIIILLCLFLLFLIYYIINSNIKKSNLEKSYVSFAEKNKDTTFSINKIVFFSSSDSKNKASSKSNFTIENLFAYTDIALFIKNYPDEDTLENTLKEVKISNIKFTKTPSVGEPKLYYKNLSNFASSNTSESNIIQSDLNFSISSDDTADLSTPTLYNNCANPIVLSYVNENIKTDYTITDTSIPITYNGSLLNRCNVSLDTINTSISFDIYITNNKDEKFKTVIYFDIPYEDNGKSIVDGSLIVNKDTNFNFYRYE